MPDVMQNYDNPDSDSRDEQRDTGPRMSHVRVGDEDLVVLSVPLPELNYPKGTTSAEQEIVMLLIQGLTVREIADRRGTALRTVTTQLQTLYRKAGVGSQAGLIAAVMGERRDETLG